MSNLYTTLYGFLVRIMTSLHHKKEGFRLEVVGLLNLLFHTLLTNTKYRKNQRGEEAFQRQEPQTHQPDYHDYPGKLYLQALARRSCRTGRAGHVLFVPLHQKKYLELPSSNTSTACGLIRLSSCFLKTDMKKIDICMESGFSDYRYLCKAFSEEYKCTPTQFRERYQGEIGPQNRILT